VTVVAIVYSVSDMEVQDRKPQSCFPDLGAAVTWGCNKDGGRPESFWTRIRFSSTTTQILIDLSV
jgi:hypothetical protein